MTVAEAPGPTVSGHYKARLGEYVQGSAWLARRSRSNVAAGIAFLAMGAVSAFAVTIVPDDMSVWAAAGGGLALGIGMVSGWYCAPFCWIAARRDRRLYEEPSDIEADAAGLTTRNGVFTTSGRWAIMRRLRENDAYFFLESGFGGAMLVPKRAFDAAGVTRFRALAIEGISAGAGTRAQSVPVPVPVAEETGSPDGSLRGSFVMGLGEMAGAAAWLLRRRLSTLVIGGGLVVLGVLQLTAWAHAGDMVTSVVGAGTVVLGIVTATGWFAYPALWMVGRRRRDLFAAPSEVLADVAGIRVSSVHYDNLMTWGTFQRIRESRSHLYLEFGGNQSVVIPTRAFAPGDLDRLRDLIAAASPASRLRP